ncbi:PEP-CTERM sorting domain-containing protein [Tundrisphaera lichenicola]|uniref:PEP-CTERM sorting domain-containing protein n=1 Tax=Tundrisphaera lichenicola TaxID=2029860 RepID=UPI003EBC13D2
MRSIEPRRVIGPARPRLGWALAASIATLLIASSANSARAGLLIDPVGGTDFTSSFVGYQKEDGSVTRSLGGSFDFYGTARTSVQVSSNGYLAFTTTPNAAGLRLNRSIGHLAGVQGAPVIAPLYYDLLIANGTHIVDTSVAGQYYAVTYENITASAIPKTPHAGDPAFGSTFQVALFTGDTLLNGFSFHAGDIALSYGALNASLAFEPDDKDVTGPTGTIGVGRNANVFTGLPTDSRGYVTDLYTLPTGNNFFLYRPDASGSSYTVSVVEPLIAPPVPEPASIIMLAIGLLPIAVAGRRYSKGRAGTA